MCQKPEKIKYFNEIKTVHLSCGNNHSMTLTEDGRVDGWGGNSKGQVGCGDQIYKSTPIELNFFSNKKIKSIHCSNDCSFALTIDGLVYSWGQIYNILGHNMAPNDCITTPKLILNLSNIIKVCSIIENTYFLSNEGLIYFCGSNNKSQIQKIPKLMDAKIVYKNIYSINNTTIGTTIDNIVYELEYNTMKETNYNNSFDYFAEQKQLVYKTIDLKNFEKNDNNLKGEIL